MKTHNVILEKSYLFALRIIKLHVFLTKELKQFRLADQVLSSGTSIGANAEEAVGGISRRDFTAKFSISYKEARETHYWLRLLRDSDLIEKDLAESLLADCEELLRILYSIINSSKTN